MIERTKTKNLIEESFKELSKKKSVDKITVKEICQNCGLTAPTFYNHFRDKYDLIAWIYSTAAEKIMSRIDSDGYEWKDTLIDCTKYFFANREFLKNLMMNTSGQNSFMNYIAQFNAETLSDYIKRSQKIRVLSIEEEICIKIYCYGTSCTLCEFLLSPLSVSVDELVEIFKSALPEPLKKYLYKTGEK